MSFEALAWAWKQKTGSPGRKAVLSALAQFANEFGQCFPSQKHLAEYTEQSERTVREHMAWLEENDFIKRAGRIREDGKRTSDMVTLNLEKPAAIFSHGDQRKNSPAADFASGEKPQKPAAKIAAQEPVTLKPESVSKNNNAPSKAAAVDFLAVLTADGVDIQVASDFIAQRKKKKSDLTLTAWKGIKKEAAKAGLTLNEALEKCLKRGWVGFEASWLGFDNQPAARQPRVNDMPTHYGESGVL